MSTHTPTWVTRIQDEALRHGLDHGAIDAAVEAYADRACEMHAELVKALQQINELSVESFQTNHDWGAEMQSIASAALSCITGAA